MKRGAELTYYLPTATLHVVHVHNAFFIPLPSFFFFMRTSFCLSLHGLEFLGQAWGWPVLIGIRARHRTASLPFEVNTMYSYRRIKYELQVVLLV